MKGQMNLFDFLHESPFCWDDDINEIYTLLLQLVDVFQMKVGKADWKIWDHVPQFGYRMTFDIILKKEQYTETFLKELDRIVSFAKKREIELSPFAPHFFGAETGHMHIFSTFEDKKRQKIRI